MPLTVFLDTSVLPRNPHWTPADFRALAELCQEGEVTVYLSSIAQREWITQMKSEFLDKVKGINHAAKELLRDPWSSNLESRASVVELRDWFNENANSVDSLATDSARAILEQLNPNILPIKGEHARDAFEKYFCGDAPYGSVKARDDIPDAFILESVRDIEIPEDERIFAVIGDRRSRQAASDVPTVVTFSSLEELLGTPEFEDARGNLHLAAAWRIWRERYQPPFDYLNEVIKENIRETTVEILDLKTVRHGQIPDDNNEGMITGVNEPYNIDIDWDGLEEFGNGIMSVPINFEVEVGIDFHVYRLNVFTVPDGVSVSWGDPERDHYFEAEATILISVSTIVVFRIPDQSINELTIGEVADLSVDDRVNIEVMESNDYEIFVQ